MSALVVHAGILEQSIVAKKWVGYWDTGSELYVFIGQLLKLNWLYTELGDFLPVHYTPIFTPPNRWRIY